MAWGSGQMCKQLVISVHLRGRFVIPSEDTGYWTGHWMGETYEFPPCFPLGFGDTGFYALDLARPKTSDGTLVFGSGEVGWADGTLEISEWGTGGWATLARRRWSGGSHCLL